MRLSIVFLTVLVACAPADTELHVQLWGEEAPVEGIPNDEFAFVDGWSVAFEHYVLAVSNVELADANTEDVVASDAGVYVVDLAQAPDPVDVTHLVAAPGRYRFSWGSLSPTAAATNVNGVDEGVLTAMIEGGYNAHLAGTATKDTRTVTFDWGLSNPASYVFCANGEDGTDGVVLDADAENEAQLTWHVDHLYWDRLGVEEADLRFEGIAAWADADGVIALDDLAGSPTAALEDRDGNVILDEDGDPLAYDDAGLGLANLRDFLLFSARESGHLDGVGECSVVAP
jgi:hypothetical protein